MEAASRGCAEAGGHVIGVTCDEIESWRPVKPNQWVQEEIRHATVKERLFSLIEECDAAAALPGGVGTLAEIAMMVNQLQVQAISPRPLVLIGAGWQATFGAFFSGLTEYVPANHRDLISFAADPSEAYDKVSQRQQ
jgi:predicted Rossmann-fold nucleotide-binding protein